jgi:hypothetical protein
VINGMLDTWGLIDGVGLLYIFRYRRFCRLGRGMCHLLRKMISLKAKKTMMMKKDPSLSLKGEKDSFMDSNFLEY